MVLSIHLNKVICRVIEGYPSFHKGVSFYNGRCISPKSETPISAPLCTLMTSACGLGVGTGQRVKKKT